jgi:SAM-dependent methyltransferase
MENYEKLNIQQVFSENDPFTEDRYRQFYKFFPRNTQNVLDIGCNTGRGGQILKELDAELVIFGLDIVKNRLDQLPKNIYYQSIYGLSTEIPCDDCTFDVVIAGEFIEHLYPIDVDQTLAEIFRVLKVGGRFLLTTPNPKDIKRKIRNQSVLGGAHVSQHFHDTLKVKLRLIGFSRIRIYGSGKVTWYLGCRVPFLSIYGSYLAMGDKF